MNLNKKYFYGILSVFGMQLIGGVSFANAMPCEEFLKESWDKTEFTTNEAGKKVKEIYFDPLAGYWQVETFEEFKRIAPEVPTKYARTWLDYEDGRPLSESEKVKQCVLNADSRRAQEGRSRFQHCALNYLYANRCDASAFSSGVSGQSAAPSQSSSSGASSNGSNSSAQSNSPESYNLQVSQNNKQNYQAMQQAYDKAMQGKGKKHNKAAQLDNCLGSSSDKTSAANKCDSAVSFTYCFSGVNGKNANPQTLSTLNCKNNEFGTIVLQPGESLPGNYKNLVLDGFMCKSPSMAIDVIFDPAENAARGKCSF